MAVEADIGVHALQEFERLLRLLGFVALVILPEHPITRGLDNNSFDRRRTYIEADHELGFMVMRLVRVLDLRDAGDWWFQRCNLDQGGTLMIVHSTSLALKAIKPQHTGYRLLDVLIFGLWQ